MIGRTVGKYRILDRLGRGGMGTVYRAIDETLDREVAIKVLNPDLGDVDVLKRFRAEAVTLARLNHPGIATIYELHRQDDDLLMVMELVRGETVHALSDRIGPLAVPQAAHLCMQVLDALGHAHRAGIVHRDLKPANLMVAETGVVKVMDFGIARMLGTEHFTHGGYMMGTPAYMAPEQVLGRDVDGRSDLYAVGVVFYRLLAGELPFKADTSIAMVQKQISEPPTPISTFRPDLPPWCTSLIDRALAKTPSDRFQSAEEFRSVLAAAARPEALGELPTMSTPAPPGLPLGATQAHASTRQPTAVQEAPTPVTTPAADTAGTRDRPTTTVVLGRTHLVTLSALLAVLIAGVGVLAFLALRRDAQTGVEPPPTSAPAAGTKTSVLAEGVPPSPAPAAAAPYAVAAPDQDPRSPRPREPVPSSSVSTPDQGAGGGAAETRKARESPVRPLQRGPERPFGVNPSTPDSQGSFRGGPSTRAPEGSLRAGRAERGARGGGRFDGRGIAGGRVGEVSGPPPRVLPVEPAVPLLVDDIRLAQLPPGRGPAREREGVLRLGDGQLSVLDGANRSPIVSVPYMSILAAFISRSPQPRWRTPDGTEVGGRVDVGRLGFLNKAERNWLIVLARNQPPVVIRLSDGSVRNVVTELHARSGIPVQRFIPR